MLRTSCNEQHSCAGSAVFPVGSLAGVLVVLHFAPAMSHRHAENVMQIAAFLPWFRIGSALLANFSARDLQLRGHPGKNFFLPYV